ncbi:MAG TPA: hypothetical protein VEM40_09270 [Nitrospirota bacterium]|nr:hypothetical protein [Nitrospirota bacterium]
MQIGVRQSIIFLTVSGLFVTMSLIGTGRYFAETRNILANTRINGEQFFKLIPERAAPYLLMTNLSGKDIMDQNFLSRPDAQELTVTDISRKSLGHIGKPVLADKRITIGPLPISLDQRRPGENRISVYPADLDSKPAAYAAGALFEYPAIFIILILFLRLSVSRIVSRPERMRYARGNHEMRNVTGPLHAVRALGRI